MACSGLMVDMRYFRFGSLLLLLPLLMGADLRMAQRALTNRNYLIALRQFTELAEQNPNWSAAHLGRAQALAGMGRCETALETLQAFRQSKAWTAKAAYAEGRCWQQQGDYSQARVAYEESVRLRPTLALGWYGLATVHAYGQDLPAMHLAIEELDSLSRGHILAAQLRSREALRLQSADFPWLQRELEAAEQSSLIQIARHQGAILDASMWLEVDDPMQAFRVIAPFWSPGKLQPQLLSLYAEILRRLGEVDTAVWVVEEGMISQFRHPILQAVRARIEVDRGELEAAQALLGEPKDDELVELAASRWYLARHTDAQMAQEAAHTWTQRTGFPEQHLHFLIPIEER